MTTLAAEITSSSSRAAPRPKDAAREAFFALRDELSAGRVRAAEPDAASPTGWRVNVWVKQGILLGFRFGDIVDMGVGKGRWPFFDKDTLPLKQLDVTSGVRIVPGGSSIREGAYLGSRRHLHAADVHQRRRLRRRRHARRLARAGRLVRADRQARAPERRGADRRRDRAGRRDAGHRRRRRAVGGNCGVYEGAIIKRRAVLASGTIITGSTPSTTCRTSASSSRSRGSRWSFPKARSSCRARAR